MAFMMLETNLIARGLDRVGLGKSLKLKTYEGFESP